MNERIEKDCSKHGFGIHVKEKSGYFRCVRCRNDKVMQRRRAVKEKLVKEAGGKCSICGYEKCLGALEFHHLDKSLKTFTIANGNSWSYDKLSEEATKCILVCANCHREEEYNRGISANSNTLGLHP